MSRRLASTDCSLARPTSPPGLTKIFPVLTASVLWCRLLSSWHTGTVGSTLSPSSFPLGLATGRHKQEARGWGQIKIRIFVFGLLLAESPMTDGDSSSLYQSHSFD